MGEKKMFLVTGVVRIRRRPGVIDQTRYRVLVAAKTEEEARSRFQPMADELGFEDFDLEELTTLDAEHLGDFPRILREYCKSRGFELAVSAALPPDGVGPNCS